MGVAPLQYVEGDFASHGLTGHEEITITGLSGIAPSDLIRRTVTVRADEIEFEVLLRIDTPTEAEYFVAGGILPYVARRLAKA
jgi:aconitate hydratase